MIMTMTLIKMCRRCRLAKKRASTWECRACGARCCEHLCGLKGMSGSSGPEGTVTQYHATCGACLLKR